MVRIFWRPQGRLKKSWPANVTLGALGGEAVISWATVEERTLVNQVKVPGLGQSRSLVYECEGGHTLRKTDRLFQYAFHISEDEWEPPLCTTFTTCSTSGCAKNDSEKREP